VAVFAFAACVAPWLVRNWVAVGTPLITSTAGENFWWGNHAGAGQTPSPASEGRSAWLVPTNPALPEEVRGVLAQGTEAERNEVFGSEAWRFIGAHPGQALELFARKTRTFWWRIDSDPRDYPPAVSIAYEVIYRIELALALFGGWLLFSGRARGPQAPELVSAGLALGLMISIGLLQSAFYVQGRHRFLIEPLLLIFTATGAMELWRRSAGRHHASGPDRRAGS
jgi:hypothetical protein